MSLRSTLIPLLLMAACGDNGATSNPDTTTADTTVSDVTNPGDVETITPVEGKQQGTTAVGAPIMNATVSGICADGSRPSGTTDGDGNFTLEVDAAALPCVLTLVGGTANGATNTLELHSFATAAGIANITPLTDLILARAVNTVARQPLATWAAAPFDMDEVAETLASHSNVLRTVLTNAGYSIPASWTVGSTAPFTTPFIANPANDPYDRLLEAFADALAQAGTSYSDSLTAYVANNAMPDAVIDPTNLPLTGDGAALAGADGVTGTLRGVTHTYSAGLSWGYLPQFGVETGSFAAYAATAGGFDPLTGWRLSGFKAEPGVYHCKSFDNDTTRVQLLLGNGAFLDTAPSGAACTIEVISISPTAVTGRFSVSFVDSAGVASGTVTDGWFFKHVDNGGGGVLAEGEVGVSFDMDGQSWRYASANSLAFEAFAGMSSAPADGPGAPIGIQIHTIPNAIGTYHCDTDPNSYRQVNIWFVWDFLYYLAGVRQFTGNGPQGSSCKIVVTKVGGSANGKYFGTFEGTFEGTFVTEDLLHTKVVTNGKFRHIGEVFEPPAYLTAMAGNYPMKVTSSSFDSHDIGDSLTVTIGADGNITVGDEVFTAGQYGVDAYLDQYHREPGILVTRGSDGMSVRLGVPDSTHLQYIQLEQHQGGSRSLYAGVRPLAPAMVDTLEDLIAGSPYTLRLVNSQGFGTVCDSHTLTVGATTVDAMNPYVKYNAPDATDGWGESSRLGSDNGDVVLTNYYSRVFFRANGSFELRSLGGSFQEFETWTNDPAAISAAGCQ